MPESPHYRFASARHRAKLRQSGMTLLELLIAMAVLSVGMLGSVVMILVAVQSNARNKNDSAAVVLDQEILEMFATYRNYPTSGWVAINDCGIGAAASVHNASVVQAAAPLGAGATLYTAATAPLPGNVGDIDWTQPAPAFATNAVTGYAMQYQTCNGDTYEIRWNVMEINPNPSSRISLLTVSSRQTAAGASGNAMLFAIPTTLRTQIEN
jgi:prepilin-type N-terminal cleavage/methylation domain-containing protein